MKLYNIKYIIRVFLIFFICLRIQELPAQEVKSFGKNINTKEDEFLPILYNNEFYFGRTYFVGTSPIQKYRVYKSIRNYNNDFDLPFIDEHFSINDFNNYSLPLTRMVELLPSVNRFFMHSVSKNTNSSYYGKNIKYHDFHPALSPDGSFIVYVSDNPGSIGRSDTTTDLYITFKLSENNWSEPINLGKEINSNQNEISPFIDKNANLYFASKIITNGIWNYDIFKAESNGYGKWKKPERMLFPVNTAFNETGALIVNDSLIFASDRRGGIDNPEGFSNYDLYYMQIPVQENIVIKLESAIEEHLEIKFENYKVPFFVTGYYYPNTKANLEKLRNLFETGIYGHNPNTIHIANPDNEEDLDYDLCANLVDKAIDEAINLISNKLDELPRLGSDPIEITFTGYADSRPIMNEAVYDGITIISSNPEFSVENGCRLDNLLLSQLRAYFTAGYFKEKLSQTGYYKYYVNRIVWKIKGNGSDNYAPLPDIEKRRVVITLNADPKKTLFTPLKIQLNERTGLSINQSQN